MKGQHTDPDSIPLKLPKYCIVDYDCQHRQGQSGVLR